MTGGSLDLLDGYCREQYIRIKPQSVVDFGAGKGKHGRILRDLFPDIRIEAVEVFEPNTIGSEGIYDTTHLQNIVDFCETNKRFYDLAIFGDVLEHLPKEQIYYTMYFANRYFKHVVINVPLRNTDQGVVDGNVYERHLSYITESDFDIYNVIEKHIIGHPSIKNYFKMNILIENIDL